SEAGRPDDDVNAGAQTGKRVAERDVGLGEVDDHVAVAEDLGQRHTELRIGASAELQVIGGGDRGADRDAHPPRRASDTDSDHGASASAGISGAIAARKTSSSGPIAAAQSRSGASSSAASAPTCSSSTASMRSIVSSSSRIGMPASTAEPSRSIRAEG